MSSRNSVAGHVSLLKAVDAKVLIADAKSRKTAEAVLQEIQITLVDVVNPEDIATDIDLSQSTIKVEPASQDVFEQVPLYLHSSGTSGHPKPIPQTHEHIVTDTIAVRTNISYVGAPVYAPLPLYHVRSSSLSSNKQLNLSPQRELVSIASPAGLWEQVTFPPLFTPSYL